MSSLNSKKDRKIYGNCKVVSPEGIDMFKCDTKKANWYLNRNLADIINKNPLIIKLNFKPNGLGNHNKGWGLSDIKNQCVICGNDNFLTKHHVVPYCYRKYFPLNIKSNDFHDVLCVCDKCHQKYEREADKLKKELSIKYNAPIDGEKEIKGDIVRLSKLANSLLKNNRIPAKRVDEIKNEIKNYFNLKKLYTTRLVKITEMNSIITKKTHGKIVVDKVKNKQSFVEMWRQHFIDNTNPKYLPKNWSIKKNIFN